MSRPVGIPSIDLLDFLSEDKEKRANFVKSIGEAYESIGFVAVRNHGISDELIDELYLKIKAFFNLTTEEKLKYEIEEIGGQRGYTSFGKEHAKERKAGDLKEFWHFGQFVEDGDPIKEVYPDNIDVAEVDDFLYTGREAYLTFLETGKKLLNAIALYLGIDENYFDQHIHNGNSILRPIHYPPIVNPEPDAVRAGEHEDINLITLLVGASADGLQVLNKQNEWVAVTSIDNHIVVNVGDMLQRLTNNRLRSTTHRVVNPPKNQWNQDRFSIPFFLHPKPDMPLNCLEKCINENNPKMYKDTLAGDYLNRRLKAIGLLK